MPMSASRFTTARQSLGRARFWSHLCVALSSIPLLGTCVDRNVCTCRDMLRHDCFPFLPTAGIHHALKRSVNLLLRPTSIGALAMCVVTECGLVSCV